MSHTWDHLLLAKFYDQRVSGQGSVNNASIYQAALGGESIQSVPLVPPSWSNKHLGHWAGQPPSSCSLAQPSGQKGTGSPKGCAGTSLRSLPLLLLIAQKELEGKRGGKTDKGEHLSLPAQPRPRARRPRARSHSRAACHASQPRQSRRVRLGRAPPLAGPAGPTPLTV